MIAFKSCPRCRRGDLYLDHTETLTCLQCGYERHARQRLYLASVAVERPPRV
jgi:ribosomal protein L37E